MSWKLSIHCRDKIVNRVRPDAPMELLSLHGTTISQTYTAIKPQVSEVIVFSEDRFNASLLHPIYPSQARKPSTDGDTVGKSDGYHMETADALNRASWLKMPTLYSYDGVPGSYSCQT